MRDSLATLIIPCLTLGLATSLSGARAMRGGGSNMNGTTPIESQDSLDWTPPARLLAALARLLEAHDYARDAGRDPWDFAVGIRPLAAMGVTTNDLRWLVCKGYAQHAREVTLPGEPGRSFHPEGQLKFGRRTCFILTASGVALAHSLPPDPSPEPRPIIPTSPLSQRVTANDGKLLAPHPNGTTHNSPPEPLLPHWDADRRELILATRAVKRFPQPSPNQERILAAFEEEGWPCRIDDPLPRKPGSDSHRRLQTAIKCLNHHQEHPLIRFAGDGTGEGIRWKFVADASEHAR